MIQEPKADLVESQLLTESEQGSPHDKGPMITQGSMFGQGYKKDDGMTPKARQLRDGTITFIPADLRLKIDTLMFC